MNDYGYSFQNTLAHTCVSRSQLKQVKPKKESTSCALDLLVSNLLRREFTFNCIVLLLYSKGNL